MRAALALAALVVLAGGGRADAATRTWQATDFSRLRVDGPFDMHVRTGVAAGVRASGDQSLLDRVSVEQHGDTLVIGLTRQAGWTGAPNANVVIDVGARSLAAAMLAGSGDVSIDRLRGGGFQAVLAGSGNLAVGDASLLRLGAMLGGSGDLTIAGHADAAVATITGSGDLNAGHLVADRADLNDTGSGTITIGAKHVERVRLSGSGDINVIGGGACSVSSGGGRSDITGSGTLNCGRGGGD